MSDFIRNLDGVIDLDAEVANRAIDLRTWLNRPKIPGSPVHQYRLRPPERVRSECVESNACSAPIDHFTGLEPDGPTGNRETMAESCVLNSNSESNTVSLR